MSDFDLRGGSELAAITRKLKRMGDGKQVRKRFTKELRAAAKPLVPKVRASIKAIPTKGTKSTGLRNRMSRATVLRVRTSGRNAGVRVLVDGRKMPSGEKALPALMEGNKKPWRHRVYGRDVWVTQEPKPYFEPVVRNNNGEVRTAVNRVLDGITRDLT